MQSVVDRALVTAFFFVLGFGAGCPALEFSQGLVFVR